MHGYDFPTFFLFIQIAWMAFGNKSIKTLTDLAALLLLPAPFLVPVGLTTI